jgi:hypothetical protein
MCDGNNDPANNLCNTMYWFEVVDTHPDPQLESVIRGLAAEFSQELGIPVPPIGWYKAANGCVASRAYSASSKARLDADPTLGDCTHFRTIGNDNSGYTPYRSHTIMSRIDATTTDVLDAVPDECFHVFQDAKHGFGWREPTGDIPDRQAQDLQTRKDRTIAAALTAYAARR